MKLPLFRAGALAVLLSTTALAQGNPFSAQVIENLQELGYEYIEVKSGPTQLKVEAVRGSDKLEVIYDLATGQILKQETEDAGDDYVGRTGVEFEDEDRDFLDSDDSDDDDDDEDEDEDDDDDDEVDDDDDSSGSGSDDDDDDGSSGSDDDDDEDEDDDDSSGDDGDDDDSSDGDDDSDDDDDDA
jgi:hypothetical protein